MGYILFSEKSLPNNALFKSDLGDAVQGFALERPFLEAIVGQQSIKDDLKMRVVAAKLRGKPLDHFLFAGSHQMGKLTLAKAIAAELGATVKTLHERATRVVDVAALLTWLREGDMLLIEDVERLNREALSLITSTARDFVLQVIVGKGSSAEEVSLNLPRFTIIGTSAYPSKIDQKLGEILALRYDLAPYTTAEMSQLVEKFVRSYGQEIKHDAAEFLAQYCEGTPGIAEVLTKRVADYCIAHTVSSVVTLNCTRSALEHLGYRQGSETAQSIERKIEQMSGIQFESFVAQVFQYRGYSVEMTKTSGDHGVDLFARKGADLIAVQCKNWAKPVGEPTVRDFYGALISFGAKEGFIVATAGFTAQAIEFVEGKRIQLVSEGEIIKWYLDLRKNQP